MEALLAQSLLVAAVLIAMLIGLAGVFLPILPGIELIWLAALAYGLLHGFTLTGGICMAALTLLAIAALTSDLWITGVGLKAAGTSLLAVVAGAAVLILASILLTPLAGILLGLGGLIAVEYVRHRNIKKAAVSAGSALAGCLLAYGFKFTVALAMIFVWGVWVWLG